MAEVHLRHGANTTFKDIWEVKEVTSLLPTQRQTGADRGFLRCLFSEILIEEGINQQ